jgi:Tol biopolymer transport system component
LAVFLGVVTTAFLTAVPAHASLPATNGRIAFTHVDLSPSSFREEITTMNFDGSGQTGVGVEGAEPAWSPDGSKIAVVTGHPENTGISIVNSDGTGLTKITEGARDDRHPTWSADGKWIAFSRYEGNSYYQLYVIGADGKGLRKIQPSGVDWGLDPEWSPDGSKIAFYGPTRYPGYIQDLPDVYTVKPDGTDLAKITDDPGYDVEPAWSPDGSKIAFVSLRDAGHVAYWRIYAMAADGTGVTRLSPADPNTNDFQPDWSPDGTKIAFDSYGGSAAGDYNIYTFNRDGSARTKLTSSVFNQDPDWQPFPRRSDYKNASQFCKAEQAFWGSQFAGRYGGDANAYGKCVTQSH